MKRCFCVILVLMAILHALSAAYLETGATTPFTVNAIMGEFMNVSLEMIPSNGFEGTPFDLTGADVWPRNENPAAGYGRRIATWSVMTNTGDRNLTISATPLILIQNASGQTVPSSANPDVINYRLAFTLLGYIRAMGGYVSDVIYVFSGSSVSISHGTYADPGILDNWVNTEDESVNMPYISEDQNVRVVLMKPDGTLYSAEERMLWSAGVYQATITITITGGDN